MRDASYSNDVEIDHTGKLVAVRDIEPGEMISIPLHMLNKIERRPLKPLVSKEE